MKEPCSLCYAFIFSFLLFSFLSFSFSFFAPGWICVRASGALIQLGTELGLTYTCFCLSIFRMGNLGLQGRAEMQAGYPEHVPVLPRQYQ